MRTHYDIDHTKKTPSGECAACAFLRMAIQFQTNPEYRAQYETNLAEAQRLHETENIKQVSLFEEA